MTTQTCNVTFGGIGPKGPRAINFTATCTDDTNTELKDETATSNRLSDSMKGYTISSYCGKYAAGAAMVRIKDTNTGEILCYLPLDLIATQRERPLPFPIAVKDSHIVEAICVAVPT